MTNYPIIEKSIEDVINRIGNKEIIDVLNILPYKHAGRPTDERMTDDKWETLMILEKLNMVLRIQHECYDEIHVNYEGDKLLCKYREVIEGNVNDNLIEDNDCTIKLKDKL